MKSSFDLAMEKLGGGLNELSSDQKSAMQDIESKYKAKEAEAELSKDERILKVGGNPQEIEQIRADYAVEMASIHSRRENAKKEIREQHE